MCNTLYTSFLQTQKFVRNINPVFEAYVKAEFGKKNEMKCSVTKSSLFLRNKIVEHIIRAAPCSELLRQRRKMHKNQVR